MKILYDPVSKGFYDRKLHKSNVPSDAIEVTEEKYKQLLEGQAQGKFIISDKQGSPILSDRPELTIDKLATRKRREIENALVAALAAGLPYTMPDGTEDTVQMQAEDRQNLLGLAIEARDLKGTGETGTVQEFRAKSNTRYPMTPDQVIAMTDAALAHYKALLQQSWDRKDAIDAALEAGDREGIEIVVW
ncbi:hypothetical protein [Halomonas sp. H5]|uniref:DUF4376 domain-containing protein n=1 Tax=Halomonas sp. H5 TaxID=3423910 RepID=UPI003D35BA23